MGPMGKGTPAVYGSRGRRTERSSRGLRDCVSSRDPLPGGPATHGVLAPCALRDDHWLPRTAPAGDTPYARTRVGSAQRRRLTKRPAILPSLAPCSVRTAGLWFYHAYDGGMVMDHVQLVRLFDPHCRGWMDHWVAMTSVGCFLVPAERGGWDDRVPCTLDPALPELDAADLGAVWDLLTRPKPRSVGWCGPAARAAAPPV